MAEVFTGVSLGRTWLEAGLWHTGGKAYEPAMATSKICQLLKGMVSTVSGVSLATYQEQKRGWEVSPVSKFLEDFGSIPTNPQ